MNLIVTPQAIATALRSISLNINFQLELEDTAGAAIAGRAGVDALASLFEDPLAGAGADAAKVVEDAMRLAVTPTIEQKPAPAEPAARTSSGHASKLTAGRAALLKTLWNDPAYSAGRILAALNKEPGPTIGSQQAIYAWADQLGLQKPRPVKVARQRDGAAPPPVPIQTAPVDPTPEDVKEAEQRVLEDPDYWTGRKLAEEYGWSTAFAAALAQRVRGASTP